jgi:hypothetical protein
MPASGSQPTIASSHFGGAICVRRRTDREIGQHVRRRTDSMRHGRTMAISSERGPGGQMNSIRHVGPWAVTAWLAISAAITLLAGFSVLSS